jgi:multisubunit Na+/H+ antiporter MnhE subunit
LVDRFVFENPVISEAVKWVVAGFFAAAAVLLYSLAPLTQTKRWVSGLTVIFGMAAGCTAVYFMQQLFGGDDHVGHWIVLLSMTMTILWALRRCYPKRVV